MTTYDFRLKDHKKAAKRISKIIKPTMEKVVNMREHGMKDGKPTKSSRFYKDESGRWFKRYENGEVMVTDEWLIDTLDIKEEIANTPQDGKPTIKEESNWARGTSWAKNRKDL